MYWGDYLADTRHLTQGEHGAYLLLMAHYWQTGGLAACLERAYRITQSTTEDEKKNVRTVLQAFFKHERDNEKECYKHKRLDKELTSTLRMRELYEDRARKAAKKRWSNASSIPSSNASSNASVMQSQSQSHSNSLLVGKNGNYSTDSNSINKNSNYIKDVSNTVNARARSTEHLAGIAQVPVELWAAYETHRIKLERPLGDAESLSVATTLAKMTASGLDASAALATAIDSGWLKPYPPTAKGKTNGKKSEFERYADQLRREYGDDLSGLVTPTG